jgi:hypothetical protein
MSLTTEKLHGKSTPSCIAPCCRGAFCGLPYNEARARAAWGDSYDAEWARHDELLRTGAQAAAGFHALPLPMPQ